MRRGSGKTRAMLEMVAECKDFCVIIVPSNSHVIYCVNMITDLNLMPGTKYLPSQRRLTRADGKPVQFLAASGDQIIKHLQNTVAGIRPFKVFIDHIYNEFFDSMQLKDWIKLHENLSLL